MEISTGMLKRQVILYVINLLLWILWQSSQLFGSLDGIFPFMEVRYPEKLGFLIVIFRPIYYVWHIVFNSLCFLPFLVSMARGYVNKRKKNLLKWNLKELNFEEGSLCLKPSFIAIKIHCDKNVSSSSRADLSDIGLNQTNQRLSNSLTESSLIKCPKRENIWTVYWPTLNFLSYSGEFWHEFSSRFAFTPHPPSKHQ
jgi:hypothetical protein